MMVRRVGHCHRPYGQPSVARMEYRVKWIAPWEGAQVAAFEVLSEIYQEFGDELVNGPIGSFPRVDASQTAWTQPCSNAFVRD